MACKEEVYNNLSRHTHVCGKPSKDDPDNPTGMCGVHLAALNRRRDASRERKAYEAKLAGVVAEFADRGVAVQNAWIAGAARADRVTISVEDLRALIERAGQ